MERPQDENVAGLFSDQKESQSERSIVRRQEGTNEVEEEGRDPIMEHTMRSNWSMVRRGEIH